MNKDNLGTWWLSFLIFTFLFTAGFLSFNSLVGCATTTVAPTLENRTLRISPTIAGFEYQYEVCAKYFLGVCTKSQMHVDYYDLTDPVVKAQLINMGFVAKVREKVTP